MSEETKDASKSWFSIGGAAFFLSLIIAIVSFSAWVMGPQVEVDAPKGAFFYREGERESSVIAVAIPIRMINRSQNYNDVITNIYLQLGRQDALFELTGIVRLGFTDKDDSSSLCTRGNRCIARTRLAITDLPDEMVQIPAGGAHAHYYSFRLICGRPGADCARYRDSETTIASLAGHPLDIIIVVELNQDGRRVLRCQTPQIDPDRLRGWGWQGLRCTGGRVEGGSRMSLF